MKEHGVVVVTGMHRSGTSLVASLVQAAGVNIGDNLLGPDRGNRLGHFEDVDFYQFHDKILRRLGQTLLVQTTAALGDITQAETEEALALIEERSGHVFWGWKDPRTTLFLDFWSALLPQARYILVYRHPIEVVLSLLRRGTDMQALVDPLDGLRAWQVYDQLVLDFYQQHADACLLAHIAAIADDTHAFLDVAARKLSLPLHGQDTQALYQAAELKQIAFPVEVAAMLEQMLPEAMQLYAQLEAQADLPAPSLTREGIEPGSTLASVWQAISDSMPDDVLRENQGAHHFSLLLATLDPPAVLAGKNSLDRFRLAHIADLEGALADLKQVVAGKQEQIGALTARVSNLEQRLAAIEGSRAWRLVKKWYALRRSLNELRGYSFARSGREGEHPSAPGLPATRLAEVPLANHLRQDPIPKVLFISHDAWRTGAPIALLHFLKWFKSNTNIPFEILLKGDGELRPEFEALAPVMIWNQSLPVNAGAAHIDRIRQHLDQANIGLIYSNTITNGAVLAALSSLKCPVISHVHELEYWINYRIEAENLKQVQKHTDHYIAASQAVKQNLAQSLKIAEDRIDVVYEFIPTQPDCNRQTEAANRIRKQLKIPREVLVVGGSGTTDWRKGPDLFVQLARTVHQRQLGQPVHFVWVGGESAGPNFGALWHDVKHSGLDVYVHFVGTHTNPLDYFAMFDVFALVSREDPFPIVNLEAASLGKPVLCFDGSGGAREFVEDDCGFVVPYLDLESMADRVIDLLNSPELRQRLGQRAATKVYERHDVTKVAPQILGIIERFL